MGHLNRVDILRGIAILCVFFYHAQGFLFPNYDLPNYTVNHILDLHGVKSVILNFSPSAFGWSGVELFLLISGFLIHLGFLSSGEKFKILNFYSKRFWRIYPPYVVTLLFFCVTKNQVSFFLFSAGGLKHVISHLFLIHNFSGSYIYTINTVFWSLALEMQLYLIYPLLLIFRKKIGMRNCFIAILIFSFLMFIIGMYFNIEPKLPYQRFVLKYWFVWVAGALLAEKYYRGEKLFSRMPGIFIVGGFVMTALCRLFFFSRYAEVYFITLAWLAFFEWFLSTKWVHMKSPLAVFLSAVGLCSYSMYLIHMPFLPDMLKYLNISANKYFSILTVIPVFIIIFLVSYSLYLFVELPSIKFGKYLRDKRKAFLEKKLQSGPLHTA